MVSSHSLIEKPQSAEEQKEIERKLWASHNFRILQLIFREPPVPHQDSKCDRNSCTKDYHCLCCGYVRWPCAQDLEHQNLALRRLSRYEFPASELADDRLQSRQRETQLVESSVPEEAKDWKIHRRWWFPYNQFMISFPYLESLFVILCRYITNWDHSRRGVGEHQCGKCTYGSSNPSRLIPVQPDYMNEKRFSQHRRWKPTTH